MGTYTYTDTTAGSISTTARSAESICLDDVWLEDVIPGFRVLYTKGREALPLDISTLIIPLKDGEYVTGKRWTSRTITIGFRLLTGGPVAYRVAFNSLFSYLKGEHKLIFNDEQDKFFIGTFQGLDSGESGTDNCVGEITFFCSNPFKYSVIEHEAGTSLNNVTGADGITRNLRTFHITYNGILPAYPRFQTKFRDINTGTLEGNLPSQAGECGYVAFSDVNGNVLQFGNPDEADGITYPKNQMLIDTILYNKNSWYGGKQNPWRNNRTSSYVDSMVEAMGSLESAYSKQVTAEEQEQESRGALDGLRYVTPATYGTGSANGWHGPTMTALLPPDEQQVSGSKDWRWYFRTKIGCADDTEMGLFRAVVVGSGGSIIASVTIKKGSSSNVGTVTVTFGSKTKTIKQDLSYYNTAFGANSPHTCNMTKTGGKLVVTFGDKTITLKDSSQESILALRLAFAWGQYRKNGTEISSLARNGLYNTKFVKMNCPTWQDVPNQFSPGDVLEVDTKSATVLLNGENAQDLGALGNDWETLLLRPGTQDIIESRSSWTMGENAQYRPDSKIYWRDVYA